MEWLAQRTPAAVVLDPWNGAAVLSTAYLDTSAVPDEAAASARAVVLRPGLAAGAEPEVLVLETEHGPLLLPGGRREPGETLAQALGRELLEEAGWTIRKVRPLGAIFLQRQVPWRAGQPYPHQEFLFAIYAAEADEPNPDALVDSETERFLSVTFRPLAEVRALDLTWPPRLHQRLFLEAAVRADRPS